MILVVDTETTGKYAFSHAPGEKCQPYLVQVAALLLDDDRREWASFCSLVRPRSLPPDATGRAVLEWAVPAEAQAIHGFSTDDCLQRGLPTPLALETVAEMAAHADTIVAHNIDFDIAVLMTAFLREMRPTQVLTRRRYCTMKSSTAICRLPGPYGFKWPKLTEAYQFFFNKPMAHAHDALADCRACAEVYFALQEHQKPRVPAATV